MTTLERNDIQRILLYGLSWRPASTVALLAIEDPARAAGWLARQLEQGNIPSADLDPERPEPDSGADHQLFVAFTHDGLGKLGLSPEVLETFLPEFRQGMTAAHRARVIGDTNGSEWAWGNPSRPVHLWCAAYARKPQFLPRWRSMSPEGCRVVEQLDCLLEPEEPFGFRDGLSQPYVQGSGRSDRAVPERDCVPAGEFILGYPNAFGVIPASPHLFPERGRAATPAAPAVLDLPCLPLSRAYDLGKNGSYLVARQLAQQVRDFQALDPVLQACMVGRWPGGKSLATHPPDSPADAVAGPDTTGNDFGYFAEDAAGLRCPLGSHVRRVNPRDSLADALLGISPAEALRRANQHRLLRRSRRYVQGMESGLLFLCFNANIERQFEFVQQAWIQSPSFAGPRHEVDPLAGTAPGEFTLRAGPDREVVRPLSGRAGLPAFVSVRGGAYLFLPGLRALRYLLSLSPGAARRGSSRAPARASDSREPPPR